MAEYVVKRLEGCLPDIRGKDFDPDRDMAGAEYAAIALYPWDESGYTPEARAYVFYDDEGLHALMCAREETICAKETRFCGNVCCDSCLEFFVAPRPEKTPDYINLECNILTTMYFAIGPDRFSRRKPETLPEGVRPAASSHSGGWWAVSFHVPMELLRKEFGIERLEPGHVMRGNFYHCDETIHPNFGTWNPVTSAKPDFHRPECFGTLRLGGDAVRLPGT